MLSIENLSVICWGSLALEAAIIVTFMGAIVAEKMKIEESINDHLETFLKSHKQFQYSVDKFKTVLLNDIYQIINMPDNVGYLWRVVTVIIYSLILSLLIALAVLIIGSILTGQNIEEQSITFFQQALYTFSCIINILMIIVNIYYLKEVNYLASLRSLARPDKAIRKNKVKNNNS